MQKKILFVSLFCFLTSLIGAQTANESFSKTNRKDTIPLFVNISYIPYLNWKIIGVNTSDGGELKYDFDVNSMTSVEGNFAIKKIGLRMGLSANIDNNYISKAYSYGGYLGIRNIWLRMQSSKVSGTYDWVGALPSGFGNIGRFNNKYFTIEILKTSGAYKHMSGGLSVNRVMGTYWGIGFTSMGFPMKVSTLVTPGGRENQQYGKPVYDTLYTAKFGTACFGFDMLRQLCFTEGNLSAIDGKPAMPFAVYATTQDKIGFGSGKVSDYAKNMAEELNPGLDMAKQSGFTTLVHYSLSVGVRYYKKLNPVFLLVAAGYDLEGAAVLTFAGAADTNKDLGYDTNFFYINHGFSVKLYISYMRKDK